MKSQEERYIFTEKSFQHLFDSFFAPLCAFAESYIHDKSAAEDAVQEVFIKLWKRKGQLNNRSIRSYLYTSVRNTCLNVLKHQKVVNKHIDHELKEHEQELFFEAHVIEEETVRLIRKAINELPEKCREIILLALHGMKNNEIAEDLNISVNTVKTQKAAAYQKLRFRLKDVFTLCPFLIETFF